MRNVIGICNLHDGPHLGELTKTRPLASVSFLGRYGLIDFTLSNFSNSKIDRVYILVENYLRSIKNHVQDGYAWVNNTKRGFQTLLFNENVAPGSKFNTDVANINANKVSFDDVESDYVVVAPPFFLTSMDFRPLIEEHVKSKKEMSVIYGRIHAKSEDFINCDTIKINEKDSTVKSFGTYTGQKEEQDVSLEIFIFNRHTFDFILDDAKNVSQIFSLRKLVNYYVETKKFLVNAMRFKGYVVPMLSFDSYVKHSFTLLKYANRQKLFLEDWPIYTTTHNTPPTLYGENASVKNSFVANGSIIKGKVENCIISREVEIEEGAVVKNSIIFTKSEIASGVKMNHVVCDKYADVKNSKVVNGKKDKYLHIPQGAKI